MAHGETDGVANARHLRADRGELVAKILEGRFGCLQSLDQQGVFHVGRDVGFACFNVAHRAMPFRTRAAAIAGEMQTVSFQTSKLKPIQRCGPPIRVIGKPAARGGFALSR
jgi:hypothetical protein